MKRFRVTLLVVCLLLGWLGYNDLSLFLRNPEPQIITIDQLTRQGAPREWLEVTDGYTDLLQAINMSGTMEIDAFLVPLKLSADSDQQLVWFETRDPQIVDALKTYYFKTDTDEERATFVDDNRQLFYGRRDLIGMTVDNLIAESNKGKLEKLLTEMNIPVSDQIIFVSEGKKPEKWRGFFFVAIALLGLVKLTLNQVKKPIAPQSESE